MRIGRLLLSCAAALLMSVAAAFAQSDYPNQMVRIVVPFSAGSNTDILARILAEKLGVLWKQTVIVENKPGIAGTVSAAHSTADGYTLMLTSNGHTVLNVMNKDVPIDPVKAFAGITPVASVPLVLVVPPSLPAKDLKEFIALAKDKPGTLNFATAGIASSNYLASELLKQVATIDIVHVPYKGTPETLTSLMRGDSQLSLAFLSTAVSYIHAGKMKALAIASAQRYPSLPDVPTFAEAGLPAYHYDAWFGLMAPAGTPAPILKKVSEDVAKVMREADVKARLDTLSALPVVSTPAQFDETIRSDADRYSKLLKAAGVAAN